MLVRVMAYLFTQLVTLGGFHDRIAEVRDLAETSGFNGGLGTSEVNKSLPVLYRRRWQEQFDLSTMTSRLMSYHQPHLYMKGLDGEWRNWPVKLVLQFFFEKAASVAHCVLLSRGTFLVLFVGGSANCMWSSSFHKSRNAGRAIISWPYSHQVVVGQVSTVPLFRRKIMKIE